jgi:hypothetical protein
MKRMFMASTRNHGAISQSMRGSMSVVFLLSLFAAVAADRISARSGDSLLRCVHPDDDDFSTHAKFCRLFQTYKPKMKI